METPRAALSPSDPVSMFGFAADAPAPKVGDLVECVGAIGWSGCARVVSDHSPGGFALKGQLWIREIHPLGAPADYERFEFCWDIDRLRVVR